MRLPKSYDFHDLIEPSIRQGEPLWVKTTLPIYGQCFILETKTRLHSLDLIHYEGTIYIIPAHPALGYSIVSDLDKDVALLIDREKWFAISNQAERMKHYSIPIIRYA